MRIVLVGYTIFWESFKKKDINPTKIESRPSKKGLGKYLFFVDFEGHKDDDLVKGIIEEIGENTYFLKVLGSYPKFYNAVNLRIS